MSQDGFFEGVYDFIPVGYLQDETITDEMLSGYLPHNSGFSITHARPVLGTFPGGIEKVLRRLPLPFWQTNQVMQIAGQYWYGERERRGVPDGYAIEFTRLGRFGRADKERSLTIEILRADVAEKLRAADDTLMGFDDRDRSWKRVACAGSQHANAVVSQKLYEHHYRGLFTGLSDSKRHERKPVTTDVAEGAFQTIYYWDL